MVFIRDEAIPLEFRKTQIINLLEDNGLALCAEGCYSRLTTISDSLHNYGDISSAGLIQKFITSTAETTLQASFREYLCLVVGISPEGNDIHAYHYLLQRLKIDANIAFLVIAPDSFISLFEKITDPVKKSQMDQVYHRYHVEFKKALTASDLVQFMIFKIASPPTALLNNLKKLLGEEKGQAAAYAASDEMQETQATLEDSNALTITLTDYLFDEKWLEVNLEIDSRLFYRESYFFKRNPSWRNAWQRSLAFTTLTATHRIYYANLELSWIALATKKIRIIHLLSAENGLAQLQAQFANAPSNDVINSLLQTPKDLNIFFARLPRSHHLAALIWLQPHLKMDLGNTGVEPRSLSTVYTLSEYITQFATILNFLNRKNKDFLITTLLEMDSENIKTTLQSALNQPIPRGLTADELTQKIYALKQTLIHLIFHGMKDFAELSFHYPPNADNPDENLSSYLKAIDFSNANLANIGLTH